MLCIGKTLKIVIFIVNILLSSAPLYLSIHQIHYYTAFWAIFSLPMRFESLNIYIYITVASFIRIRPMLC